MDKYTRYKLITKVILIIIFIILMLYIYMTSKSTQVETYDYDERNVIQVENNTGLEYT